MKERRRFRILNAGRGLTLFFLLVLLIGGGGFVFRLWEFIRDIRKSGELSFAILPVAAYLITALGFTFLLLWSILIGQFKDVEEPKYRMLADEERYRETIDREFEEGDRS